MSKKQLLILFALFLGFAALLAIVSRAQKAELGPQTTLAKDVKLIVHSSTWDGQLPVNRTEINVPQGTYEHSEGYVDALVVDVTIVNSLTQEIRLACRVFDLDQNQGFSTSTDSTTVPHSESFSITRINAQSSRRGKLSYAVPRDRTHLILDCHDGITQTLQLQ